MLRPLDHNLIATIAGVVGAIAAVFACFQASGAKRAAINVGKQMIQLEIKLEQVSIPLYFSPVWPE